MAADIPQPQRQIELFGRPPAELFGQTHIAAGGDCPYAAVFSEVCMCVYAPSVMVCRKAAAALTTSGWRSRSKVALACSTKCRASASTAHCCACLRSSSALLSRVVSSVAVCGRMSAWCAGRLWLRAGRYALLLLFAQGGQFLFQPLGAGFQRVSGDGCKKNPQRVGIRRGRRSAVRV